MGFKLLTKRLQVTHVTHCATPSLILYREASLRYQINFRTMCILKSVLSILVLIQQTLTDHKILTLTSGYIKINTLCWIYGINLWPIINILLLKHLFLISKVSHCGVGDYLVYLSNLQKSWLQTLSDSPQWVQNMADIASNFWVFSPWYGVGTASESVNMASNLQHLNSANLGRR